MALYLQISRRISLSASGKSQSPAVKVAVIAVALSFSVMLAAICIVNGFNREIRDKVAGFNSHITIVPSRDSQQSTIRLSPAVKEYFSSIPYVNNVSGELSVPAVLKTESDFKGVYVKGIDEGDTFDFIAHKSIVSGHSPDFTSEEDAGSIIISQQASNQLGISAGDSLLTYFITDDIRLRKLKVSGIYNSRFENYDNLFAYAPISTVREISGIGPEDVTSIHIHTSEFDSIPYHTLLLHQRLSMAEDAPALPSVNIENIFTQGASFFQWLSLLDTNVIVILVLMGIVTIVTMISAMLIVITDKIKFIGILKSLGTSNLLIRKIFIMLSLKVTVIGLFIGNAIMIPMLLIQEKFRIFPLDPESYYIDFVPVEMSVITVVALNAAVILLVVVSLLLPSGYVAKISPAETLKYD